MDMRDIDRIGKAMRSANLTREQALPIAEVLAEDAKVSVRDVLATYLPFIGPAQRSKMQQAGRSRTLRAALVREEGAHEYPEPVSPEDRALLVNVLGQEARRRGLVLRTFLHGPTRRYFYALLPEADAPPGVRGGQGHANPPAWVLDLAPDLAKARPEPKPKRPKPLTV